MIKSMLHEAFISAIKGVNPSLLVKKNLKLKSDTLHIGRKVEVNLSNFSNIFLCGAGKASVSMAEGVLEIMGERISRGIIASSSADVSNIGKIQIIKASHPYPDERSLKAGEMIYRFVSKLKSNDLLLFLTSGGGSALAVSPENAISLFDKIRANMLLIQAGADISEINCVRKKISKIKGGKLAKAAYPATVINLIISDVAGDDISTIASAPFVRDNAAYKDVLFIIWKYSLNDRMPESVMKFLKEKASKRQSKEKENDWFENVNNVIIGSNITALKAAEKFFKKKGINTLILSSLFQGDVRALARFHAEILKEGLKSGNPLKPPFAIISGGEAAVAVKGKGKGGRNLEFALHLLGLMKDEKRNWGLLSAGTDGIDGNTDAAGVIIDEGVREMFKKKKLKINNYLDNNDSYTFFKKAGGLLTTGPTGTNVADIRIILCTS